MVGHQRTYAIAVLASCLLPVATTRANDQTGTPPAQAIVVTGSHIRQIGNATPSPVQVITAQQIKASGFTTLS